MHRFLFFIHLKCLISEGGKNKTKPPTAIDNSTVLHRAALFCYSPAHLAVERPPQFTSWLKMHAVTSRSGQTRPRRSTGRTTPSGRASIQVRGRVSLSTSESCYSVRAFTVVIMCFVPFQPLGLTFSTAARRLQLSRSFCSGRTSTTGCR